MTTENAIILHSILSGILVLASPFILMGYVFALAGLAMDFSRGNRLSGFGGLFILSLFSYPVFVNIYGWYVIYNGQPHTGKVFLYPFYGTIILFIYFVISFYRSWVIKRQ